MNKYIKIIPKTVKKLLKEYQYASERGATHVLLGNDVPVLDHEEKK